MCNIMEIADSAQIVVNGYAFTKEREFVRILNHLPEISTTGFYCQ
ncbi:MAG: hypothetical protein R3Y24_12245 [Eubacteriales bacterium]